MLKWVFPEWCFEYIPFGIFKKFQDAKERFCDNTFNDQTKGKGNRKGWQCDDEYSEMDKSPFKNTEVVKMSVIFEC